MHYLTLWGIGHENLCIKSRGMPRCVSWSRISESQRSASTPTRLDCLWEIMEVSLLRQWPGPFSIFFFFLTLVSHFTWLSPASNFSFTDNEVKIQRKIVWWVRTTWSLAFCRNIIFALFAWPLQAAGESRQGSLRGRMWKTCLGACQLPQQLWHPAAAASAPIRPCASRLRARNRVATRSPLSQGDREFETWD